MTDRCVSIVCTNQRMEAERGGSRLGPECPLYEVRPLPW